ncbi:hypothetical protein SISNIDRAFT_485050 [Sistotremastrum niveocremeum HHB9708]|uniref:Uncharacterized protein n=1 Tax=Sistotremastrum niveocremeum HHB9708 TaxID=1314777 RepID=A0A164VFU3_9AGAM|nr:hypothetical protein SISNIDRAFT_485050 [Sistotremastrum niveocremeum HHB9708]
MLTRTQSNTSLSPANSLCDRVSDFNALARAYVQPPFEQSRNGYRTSSQSNATNNDAESSTSTSNRQTASQPNPPTPSLYPPLLSSSYKPPTHYNRIYSSNNYAQQRPLSQPQPQLPRQTIQPNPRPIASGSRPLQRSDTLLDEPPSSPPLYPLPDFVTQPARVPQGTYVTRGTSPIRRDYAYADRNPFQPKSLEPTKTFIEEPSQASQSPQGLAKLGGLGRQTAFLADPSEDPFATGWRPSSQNSQPNPLPEITPATTESQEYTYVVTPIVSPNGTLRFLSSSPPMTVDELQTVNKKLENPSESSSSDEGDQRSSGTLLPSPIPFSVGHRSPAPTPSPDPTDALSTDASTSAILCTPNTSPTVPPRISPRSQTNLASIKKMTKALDLGDPWPTTTEFERGSTVGRKRLRAEDSEGLSLREESSDPISSLSAANTDEMEIDTDGVRMTRSKARAKARKLEASG